MKHPNASQTIAALDAETEYEEIVRLLSTVVFPWDIERSLEFALYRTYAVPSISGLLFATGEFTKNTCKRYDDTELLLAEVQENGFESDSGKEAMDRINTMHSRYTISNENFLYVLSAFVFEPQRWLLKFGWRALTAHEMEACFNYYIELGRRMNIQDLPNSLEVFERYNIAYEEQHFRFADCNAAVAEKTRDLFLGFYLPKPLWFLGRPIIYALMDKPLLVAFNFPEPGAFIRGFANGLLKLRSKMLKVLPKNTKEVLISARKRPTYPMGYAIKNLGTFETKK